MGGLGAVIIPVAVALAYWEGVPGTIAGLVFLAVWSYLATMFLPLAKDRSPSARVDGDTLVINRPGLLDGPLVVQAGEVDFVAFGEDARALHAENALAAPWLDLGYERVNAVVVFSEPRKIAEERRGRTFFFSPHPVLLWFARGRRMGVVLGFEDEAAARAAIAGFADIRVPSRVDRVRLSGTPEEAARIKRANRVFQLVLLAAVAVVLVAQPGEMTGTLAGAAAAALTVGWLRRR